MKANKLFATLLFSAMCFAQNAAVVPYQTSGGSTTVTTGRKATTPDCEIFDKSRMRVNVTPKCYPGNLRRVQGRLEPQGGDVIMSMVFYKGNSYSKSSYQKWVGLKFPPRAVWPQDYGLNCTVTSGVKDPNVTSQPSASASITKVSCNVDGVVHKYNCKFNLNGARSGSRWLPRAKLDKCEITSGYVNGDSNHPNNRMGCSYIYKRFKNGATAATTGSDSKEVGYRYYPQIGKVSCGMTVADSDYSSDVTLVNKVPWGSSKFNSSQVAGEFKTASYKADKIEEVEAGRSGMSVKLKGIDDLDRRGTQYDAATGMKKEFGDKVKVKAFYYQYRPDSGKYEMLTVKTGDPGFNASNNQQCLESGSVQFLGTNTFCGSFFSPLMLFFDKEIPKFNGSSQFPLYFDDGSPFVHWVEPGAPGHFLVHDKNGNGQVDSVLELFGDAEGHPNGFEKLREFDSNDDQQVDAKDPGFKKLLLWRDANGDGLTDKGELVSLESMGVKSFSLLYRKDGRSFGGRAESREKSKFVFERKGKKVIGKVLDIYFGRIGR
jgi:hypothetical protein